MRSSICTSKKNPFRNYNLKPEHNKDKDHLTKAELEILIRKEMPNERLSRIRDVFAFCCLTGLAFTDADHLRPEHIGADWDGTLWIHKPRKKIVIMSRSPLLPYVIMLLLKYGHDENVSHIENGGDTPSVISISRLCRFYGITLDEFFAPLNYPPKEQ